ncbi:hypothetical protein KKH43_01445 [Patescibacteria group bacterium]|nr:hypothetical protein [Patescibacteria group bacterium]
MKKILWVLKKSAHYFLALLLYSVTVAPFTGVVYFAKWPSGVFEVVSFVALAIHALVASGLLIWGVLSRKSPGTIAFSVFMAWIVTMAITMPPFLIWKHWNSLEWYEAVLAIAGAILYYAFLAVRQFGDDEGSEDAPCYDPYSDPSYFC